MTSNEAITKIKQLLGFDAMPPASPAAPAPAAPVAPAPVQYPLADGTIATISQLAVGGTVTINGAPAPDGDITLADGTTVTTVGGVITEVETQAAEAAEQVPAQLAKVKSEFEAFKKESGTMVAGLKNELAQMKEAFKLATEQLEVLGKTPIAEPIEKVPAEKKEWTKMSPLEKFRALK